jgi:hypothetical protein
LNLFLVRPLAACTFYLLSIFPQVFNAFADRLPKCCRNRIRFIGIIAANKVCAQTSDGVFQGLGLPNRWPDHITANETGGSGKNCRAFVHLLERPGP